jgi:hypothetical protein
MARFANSAPFVRSFSFIDGEQRVAGGSAVVVAQGPAEPDCGLGNEDDEDDIRWSDAETAAFMAGAPLKLGWLTQSAEARGSERVYVCCWISIDDDHTAC